MVLSRARTRLELRFTVSEQFVPLMRGNAVYSSAAALFPYMYRLPQLRSEDRSLTFFRDGVMKSNSCG